MSETVVKDFKVKNGLVVAEGGIFGGTVSVATPTDPLHAATKAYVDANAGGNASIQVSDTAPLNPTEGNAWFDSTTGRFYIYFDLTWIEIGGSGGGSGGSGNFTLSETAPATASAGDTWFNTAIAKLYVYFDEFWVEVSATGPTGATGPMFLDYQGAWSSTIGYNENDGVSYGGSLWRLNAATSAAGSVPSTPDWQLVVQKGDKGDTGEITVGTVTTVVNGTPATVTNSGTTTDAILDFEIPAGPRSTIEVGTVTAVPNGTPATVTNSGDASDAIFNFEIPAGPRSTIEIGTVTTGDYSSQVTVVNSGTTSDAIFDISIPQGIPGDFVVSETPPANPLEGHVWYDSTRAKAYIYYDNYWVEYAPGFVGPQGPAGQDAVLNIIGEYNNGYDYQPQDCVTYNGSLYIRTGEANTGYPPTDTNYWTLIVSKGDQGIAGQNSIVPGPTGQDGLSAYQIAVANGFVGTEQQWLDSISQSAVSSAVAIIVDSAPSTLDTLNELAAALADDASFATTITNAIATKANSDSPTITDPTFTINDVTTYVPADVSMQNWGAPDTGVIRFQIWDGVGAPAIATVGSTIYLTGTSQNGLNIDNINIVIDSVDDFGMYVQIILHAASAGDNAAVDAYLLGLTGNLSTVIVNKASTKTITSAELSYLDGVTSNIQTQINNAGPISTAVSSNITLTRGKYFVDTSSDRTLTLPASPELGDEIQIFDATGTAGTNIITVANNGNKINGVLDSASLDVNGVAAVFIWTGSTYGWRMG